MRNCSSMRCNERVASASSRLRRFCKGLKKLPWAVDAPGGVGMGVHYLGSGECRRGTRRGRKVRGVVVFGLSESYVGCFSAARGSIRCRLPLFVSGMGGSLVLIPCWGCSQWDSGLHS